MNEQTIDITVHLPEFTTCTMPNGVHMTVPKDDHVGRHYQRGEWYESGMLAYIRNKGIGKRFMEVGAFIGGHALYYATECRAEAVYAIEPSVGAHSMLHMNILENGLEHIIHPILYAAGSRPGRASLQTPLEGNMGSTQLVPDEGGTVLVETLDMIWKALGRPAIDILKIDVEGMAADVLRGAPKLLKKHMPLIFIECDGEELEAVRAILEPMGYTKGGVFNKTPTHEFKPPARHRVNP